MIIPVTWAILYEDGRIEKGRCTKPPPGWFDRVRSSVGVALRMKGYPPVYAVRPVLCCDVEVGLEGEVGRFWGLRPTPGSSVWLFPDGSKLGVGLDTTEVDRLVLAFQGKLSPQEVASGPDQRGSS